MRVRMKVSLSGSLNGQRYPDAGEEFDVPDSAGANLCSRGFAEPVAKPEKKVEKAVPKKRVEKRG